MVEVTYEIVEHDGGWAYRVDGVYSKRAPSVFPAHLEPHSNVIPAP